MKKFDVWYDQELLHSDLEFIDILDQGDEKANNKAAYKALNAHRDGQVEKARIVTWESWADYSHDHKLADYLTYKFDVSYPVWVPGVIQVLAKNEEEAIAEAKRVMGNIVVEEVLEYAL